MEISALHIQLYQPHAHFRIPFTYQRRHTYPIPPYSTVIGMLVNLLGLFDQQSPMYQQLKKIKIGISGGFETKTTENIWFRNLSKKRHIDTFGTEINRIKNGEVNHPGGQTIMKIDVLENFHCDIHIAHPDSDFLNFLKENIVNPKQRLEVIHLGRAEDWIVLSKPPKLVKLETHACDANFNRFFWIPENQFASKGMTCSFGEYEGLFYNLPTFAYIEDYEQTFNRHGKRSFDTMRTKLSDGSFKDCSYMWDKKEGLPVFLADLENQSQSSGDLS